ncbi:polysaccharide deacetylase family protein [Paenibacillus protaetiae]|uniref:Polysaccharide deacetylase family protein n=2 Tax=Paenibacillus protaetiae TaxID=2509456 RepID=A0A4P6F2X7_9BACL|nr:polysaccharide deacetylase family protein [Paenibacillus protaetiae]
MTIGLATALAALLCGFDMPAEMKNRTYYEKRGEIVWEVPMQSKKIALTFDDGPFPESTEPILDLLKQYHAKATFFVVGNRAEKFPDTVKREVEEGHEIANHTFTHLYLKANNSGSVQDEILRTEHSIEHLTGKKTLLFRPPGGVYNEQMVQMAKRNGYTVVLWSWHQDTNDWRKPGVRYIVNKVLKNARNGDIILMHDYVPSSLQTLEAMKIILPELSRRGFQMVTVSELLHGDRPDELLELMK